MIPALPPSRWRVYRRRFTDRPADALLALLGVNGALTYFIQPARSTLRTLPASLSIAWIVLFGLGGLLTLAGILSSRANVEAAGWCLFAGGALISGITVGLVLGWLVAWNSVLVLALYAGCALVRTWHASRGRIPVLLEPPEELP